MIDLLPFAAVLALLGVILWATRAVQVTVMPPISDEERHHVVNDLRGLAADVGYSEPDVGIFGNHVTAEYINRLATMVEDGKL